jgi:hypothetical protein
MEGWFIIGVGFKKCSEGFGFSHFYVKSPCNLIEDYTQIFYMIDKGDILSVECKMSLRGPKSMRKVGCLSFILICFLYFNVFCYL